MSSTRNESESDYIDCVTEKPEPINGVDDRRNQNKAIYAEMLVNKNPVKFHIDCGATVNVLPLKYVLDEELIPTNKTLVMWNMTELRPKGTCRTTIRNP